ncbi:MAG: HAMP domain-containing protein [Clostridia bacterium]|nr:HAMP domain-containing protein [Clostridia bacterium]
MPKLSSSFSRLLMLILIIIVGASVALVALSSYYFQDIYAASLYDTITGGLREAERLDTLYQIGLIGYSSLYQAVNPPLNSNGDFYMLLTADRQVIAYTETAAPYFAGGKMASLLDALDKDESAIVREQAGGKTALIAGLKTEMGYVLAGRPMRTLSDAAISFRDRMLISMGVVLLAMVAVSVFSARRAVRPARIITEMAGRLVQGEKVTLPENLPGDEIREIAGALNQMSASVAQAISDLKCEKETMALILEGLSEGILAVDEKGGILHENATAWTLLGGEETDAYKAVMTALQEKHEGEHWDSKFTAGDRVLYIAVSRLPSESRLPRSRGTVALIRDITEQEHLERTRHDYVANISHELRTPLASIRGLGEGLRDGLVTEEKDRQKYYNIIVEEVTRLSRLVNDMLELSSLQSNPAAFEMERVDPNELIYDLHDRNSSLFTEKQITFERALPDEPLPDIRSNEDRLSQVLTIFLDNARKFTPEGGTVTLGAEKTDAGTRFFVRDTGIGMDEETQRLAFDRFHQAERSHSGKGSGLGLSIAKEVLQKMGVEITLKSALGEGSELSFVIPDAQTGK